MIGILSDSHDNLNAIRDAVRVFRAAGCDLVIHAGDFVENSRCVQAAGLFKLSKFPGAPARAVLLARPASHSL